MSSRVDLPVRHNGKLYRFIASGDKAALFDKGGSIALPLTVTEMAAGRRIPKVVDAQGAVVTLARGSRPCSCKGAPWNSSFTSLEEQL